MANTPDPSLNHRAPDPDFAAYPPEYQPTHTRLVRDGERWRRRVPDGQAALERSRAARTAAPSALTAEPDRALREARRPTFQGLQEPMDTPTSPRRAHWRAMAGAVAAALVVGALVSLLIHFSGMRDGARSTSSAITLLNSESIPQDGVLTIASSNPNIVYQVQDFNLKRSTDGGRTYQSLDLSLNKLNIGNLKTTGTRNGPYMEMAVSPIDASRVFLVIFGEAQDSTVSCSAKVASSSAQANANKVNNTPIRTAARSGSGECFYWFYSSDMGATWITLPDGPRPGAPSNVNAFNFGDPGDPTPLSVIAQAQGNRLYTTGNLVGKNGLVVSDDDGVTWKPLNVATTATGMSLTAFAAAPTGKTLYSVYGDTQKSTFVFYRSDDDGQTWIKTNELSEPEITSPPAVESMRVAANGTLAFTTYGPPYAQANNILISQNKGATFITAPSDGFPTDCYALGPVGMLSDGSVIIQADKPVPSATPTGPQYFSVSQGLYIWKPGQSSWTVIPNTSQASVNADIAAVVVTPTTRGDILSLSVYVPQPTTNQRPTAIIRLHVAQ